MSSTDTLQEPTPRAVCTRQWTSGAWLIALTLTVQRVDVPGGRSIRAVYAQRRPRCHRSRSTQCWGQRRRTAVARRTRPGYPSAEGQSAAQLEDARQLVARACAVSDNEVSTLVGQVGKRLWRPDQNQASALDRDGGGASERPTESIHSPTSSSVTHSLAPYSRRRLAAISDSSAGLKVCLQASSPTVVQRE